MKNLILLMTIVIPSLVCAQWQLLPNQAHPDYWLYGVNPTNANTIFLEDSISRDGGETWLTANYPAPVQFLFGENPTLLFHQEQGDTMFFVGDSSFSYDERWIDHPLYRSFDSGESWEFIPPDTGWFDQSSYITDICIVNNVVYASMMLGGVTISEDWGETWTSFNWSGWFEEGDMYSPWLTQIEVNPSDPETIYIGNYFWAPDMGVVQKSTDGGETWYFKMTGIDTSGYYTVLDLDMHPDNPEILYVLMFSESFRGTDIKLYKSVNSAETWQEIFWVNDGGSEGKLIINPLNPDTLYLAIGVANSECPVYRSTNSGITWDPFLLNLPNEPDFQYVWPNIYLAADENSVHLFANVVRNESQYIYTLEDPGFEHVVPPSLIVPSYYLFQNYPNPFNPTTTISFNLLMSGQINLTVFNQLGERVSSLLSGYCTVGHYEVVFDGTNLPSGIYFYRLNIGGNFTETKRMVLVK